MKKKCENCGLNEVSGERDVCEECIEKTLKEGSSKNKE